MLEAYIRLSDELEEKEWRFTIIRKMGQMRVYIVMKSGKYFQIAPKIHFDRLKLEGACHMSLLSKIKDVQNPMLLIVGKHDVVTCENKLKYLIKMLETASISYLKRAVIHLIMRKQIDSQKQSYIFEMKKRVLLLIRSILSKFLDM